MFEPDYAESCLECHSTDYRLAPAGNKPGMWDVFYSIECVACHGPHGTANVGQLRQPPRDLCAECHTMQGAVPPDEPQQPQTEVLHGTGGYDLDGTPLDGPYTMHWWGIADECAVCHVHEEPYGGPQQPVNSGHTFEANMRACEPCHSETTATMLVTDTQQEILTRLTTIGPYFDPGDPLYVEPPTDPGELAQYNIAKFNYVLAEADKSFGTHNGAYARALLSETESYLGIPPWPARAPGGDAGTSARAAPEPQRRPEVYP
jgi:predicted CXXCH cytochrome family protein